MVEIWKAVKDFEGLYEISNIGTIRSLDRISPSQNRFSKMSLRIKGRKLKPFSDKGYWRLELYKNGKPYKKFVHRLVCESFIPNPENKPQVNHKNGIRSDSRVENLEWVTSSENCKHSWDVLKNPQPLQMKGKFGADHPKSIPVVQCDLNGNLIKIWGGAHYAARVLNFRGSDGIRKCVSGKREAHMGFTWRRPTAQEIAGVYAPG